MAQTGWAGSGIACRLSRSLGTAEPVCCALNGIPPATPAHSPSVEDLRCPGRPGVRRSAAASHRTCGGDQIDSSSRAANVGRSILVDQLEPGRDPGGIECCGLVDWRTDEQVVG
ncbi:hypothetical protein RSP781_24440 [Ralstonia pseudosolanacearum]|nr:hypothetical protein RSP781_24440 [Ralstonia pseudosolanacearum]